MPTKGLRIEVIRAGIWNGVSIWKMCLYVFVFECVDMWVGECVCVDLQVCSWVYRYIYISLLNVHFSIPVDASVYIYVCVYVYEYVCSKYVYTGWNSNHPTEQICVFGCGSQEAVEKHACEAEGGSLVQSIHSADMTMCFARIVHYKFLTPYFFFSK